MPPPDTTRETHRTTAPLIVCHALERRFRGPGGEITALADINLSINRGEFVVVKGPSGCGKSTLLLVLGGMQRPGAGQVRFHDRDLYGIPATERNRIRAHEIGFVFQLFHLIPYLTVRENILAGLPPDADPKSARPEAERLIAELGLTARAAHRPGTLSAGERQRVALARALVKRPALILADEPTGNLDPANASEVFRHLAAYQRTGGTVVVVTHGVDALPEDSRTIHLAAGRLVPAPGFTPSAPETIRP